MIHGKNFLVTEIIINDNKYKMEYELKNLNSISMSCFGNVYIDEKEPIEFTFAIINSKIVMYTPLNASKEFVRNIAATILGKSIPFEEVSTYI